MPLCGEVVLGFNRPPATPADAMKQDYTAAAAITVSWETLQRDTHALARRLTPLGPFRGIVAVARGGLVPAALIARHLDVRIVDTVCIASYDERVQGRPRVLKGIAGDGEGWLAVDDLTDSGGTAHAVRAMLPKVHFTTVYAKPLGRAAADSYEVEVEQDVWLVFPWDAEV